MKKNQLVKTDNLEKLSKKELIKMVQDGLMPINNPEGYKVLVEKAMPNYDEKKEWLKKQGGNFTF